MGLLRKNKHINRRRIMGKEKRLAYEQLCARGMENCGYAPAYEGSGSEEFIPSFKLYGSYYVLEHGATKADYDAYCDKLEKSGFELYSSKTSNGNSFATYTDGENIINVSQISYRDVDRYITRDMSYVSIAVDNTKNSILPPKSGEFEKITTIQFTSFREVAFIIRLPDGRFLIVDAHLNRDHIVDSLYEELCRQNVREGKPVIAAWMFTHAHGDHVGGIIGLIEKYADKVEIQTVIHNFPGEETYFGKNYMEYRMDHECHWMNRRVTQIKELMDSKMPEGRFAIAHAGQVFEYPDAKVEIVYTSENLYRQQMIDSNASSVVYLITLPGGKVLALGDAVDIASKTIRKMYGKALTCDMVILAHHAFNGGDEELYHNTHAKAALWPLGYEGAIEKECIGAFVNHFDTNIVEHNILMSQDDVVMTLYEGMSEEYFARYDRKLAMVGWDDKIDYDARKNPKHYLTEDYFDAGYGLAPRYYGLEDTETFEINEEEKSYTVTLIGATEYDFDRYCNTIKRDGYRWYDIVKGEDARSVRYASLRNSVYLSFLKAEGKITIKVGPAGENVIPEEDLRDDWSTH